MNSESRDKLLTPLLGTQSGVPCFRTPASMQTPITMGSLELKMNCGRTRSFTGNTATCLMTQEVTVTVRRRATHHVSVVLLFCVSPT